MNLTTLQPIRSDSLNNWIHLDKAAEQIARAMAAGDYLREYSLTKSWIENIERGLRDEKLKIYDPTEFRERDADDPDWTRPSRNFRLLITSVNTWLRDELKLRIRIDDPEPCSASSTGEDSINREPIAPSRQGIPKAKILMSEWPLKGTYTIKSLADALGNQPLWLRPAIVIKGVAGVRSTTWNPALIGVGLVEKKHSNRQTINRLIRTDFPDWIDDWEYWQDSQEA
jgi:hypothetical protein